MQRDRFARWFGFVSVASALWLGVLWSGTSQGPYATSAGSAGPSAAQQERAPPVVHGRRPAPPAVARAALPAPDPGVEPYGDQVSPEEQMVRGELVARDEDRLLELEARFEDESADLEWAPRIDGRLRALLGESGLSAEQIEHVECRSTLCRVELSPLSEASVPSLLKAASGVDARYWIQRAVADAGTALTVFLEPARSKD